MDQSKVIDMFKPAPVNGERVFMDVLSEYSVKHIKELSLKPETVKKYSFFTANIKKYLKATGQERILLSQIRHRTMEEMRYWLQTTNECTISHASRHAELCKRVMNYAVMMEYTLNNPLSAYSAKRERPKEVVHLEKAEREKFVNHPFKTSAFMKAADLAVFQMFTGLSYGDLSTYQLIERGGKYWIANKRAKNSSAYYVPLFPEAKAIHDKYKGKLPHISNHYYNRLLKEISTALEIDKHLTSHVFRKTMATMMDEQGVSGKTIATMLGNTVQVLEQHYLAKSPKRMENELTRLGIEAVQSV